MAESTGLASSAFTAFTRRQLAAYGLLGFPLALVALPLYVYLPQFYVENAGLSLAVIGAILLGTRLLDAFIDPVLGAWVDGARHQGGQRGAYAGKVVLALPFLLLGFVALFHGPLQTSTPGFSAGWLAGALLLVYFGFSLASIAYQAWGAELTTVSRERTRITAAREGAGLVGVVLGAALPQALGMGVLTSLFCVSLVISVWLLVRYAPRPVQQLMAQVDPSVRTEISTPASNQSLNWRAHLNFSSFSLPFSSRRFRWLLAVFLLNGIAAATPATLVTFFISDVLQASSSTGIFLALYFLSGAASMPLWVKCSARWGQARAWWYSMGLAVLAFAGVYGVAEGDVVLYGLICVLSGLTLGADLALPPALLADVIHRAGHKGQREGTYFGLWNFATKLNLALAAGISLPLLAWLGYVPGNSGSDVQVLSSAYALLPCVFKLLAAALLWSSPLIQTKIQTKD